MVARRHSRGQDALATAGKTPALLNDEFAQGNCDGYHIQIGPVFETLDTLNACQTSGGEVTHFDTPRRLAVMASGLAASQANVTEQITGPSVSVGYKNGQPTPAAHAFAKKSGVDVTQLEKVTTPKGEYLSAKVTKKGRSALDILAEDLPKELSAIYWPKNMYWRKPNERFVRPVRWLVAMLDDETIPLEFDGIRAGNTSRGHRILAAGAVPIPRAGSAYVDSLRAAKVLGRAERARHRHAGDCRRTLARG